MIAKNELTATLEAVRAVAGVQGVDTGTVLQCALLGVLDDINAKLGDHTCAVREGQEMARSVFSSALGGLSDRLGLDLREDVEAEDASLDPVEVLRRQLDLVASQVTDLRQTVRTAGDALTALLERIEKIEQLPQA